MKGPGIAKRPPRENISYVLTCGTYLQVVEHAVGWYVAGREQRAGSAYIHILLPPKEDDRNTHTYISTYVGTQDPTRGACMDGNVHWGRKPLTAASSRRRTYVHTTATPRINHDILSHSQPSWARTRAHNAYAVVVWRTGMAFGQLTRCYLTTPVASAIVPRFPAFPLASRLGDRLHLPVRYG